MSSMVEILITALTSTHVNGLVYYNVQQKFSQEASDFET